MSLNLTVNTTSLVLASRAANEIFGMQVSEGVCIKL